MKHAVDDFRIADQAMRYSLFAPRLYNLCLSLGFRPGLMLPSRAFCSDETQGYPVILLMQHFGVFPFDHGFVGGRVATDRHGPHAHHGEDLIIVQASHVGYDPESEGFGIYPRGCTQGRGLGDNCGKLCAVLSWYRREYESAKANVRFGAVEGEPAVVIDNSLLERERTEGLFLRLERFIGGDARAPRKSLSTSKAFAPADEWRATLDPAIWTGEPTPIGERLKPEHFGFRRAPQEGPEGHDYLEDTLAPAMPSIVTSAHPALDAARYHTQCEFDRAYRSLRTSSAYRGKQLLFVAGLNVDVAPPAGMPFPLTKFVPWAAYFRSRDGEERLFEQDALCEALAQQATANPHQVSFDAAIAAMSGAEGVTLRV